MKKILSIHTLILSTSCLILNSCTQEPPPDNLPKYIEHLRFNPDYFAAARVADMLPPCLDGEGNCTMILPSKDPISLVTGASFRNFRRFCNNKMANVYFSHDPYWHELFPGLQTEPGIFQKIMEGFIHPLVLGDSIIVFYQGSTPAPGNIVKTYWLSQ